MTSIQQLTAELEGALQQNKFQDALPIVRSAREVAENVAELWRVEIMLLAALNIADEAVALCETAMRRFPFDPQFHQISATLNGAAPPNGVTAQQHVSGGPGNGEVLSPNALSQGPDRNLNVYRLQNITVSSPRSSAFSENGCAIIESFVCRPFEHLTESDVVFPQKSASTAKRVPGEWLVLNGVWSSGFFHWMTEWIPRLILAEASGFRGNIALRDATPFQIESLELLGIDRSRLHIILEPFWRPDVLWVTDFFAGVELGWYPALIGRERELFLDAVPQKEPFGHSRLFSPRRNPNRPRRIVNEDELLNLLKRYDFVECNLEAMSFTDQINAMRGCRALVGPHGAGMVHTMFMPEESFVIELFAPTYVNPTVLSILDRFKHRYSMVTSTLPFGEYKHGQNIEAFIAPIELALKNELRR